IGITTEREDSDQLSAYWSGPAERDTIKIEIAAWRESLSVDKSTATFLLPAVAEIMALHDRYAGAAARQPIASDALWRAIDEDHLQNCQLWAQEDLARRTDVPDSEIAANKRAIDIHNQKRNDAIERIDEQILDRLKTVERKPGARMNSETAGSIIDRLSIAALKIHHMRIQTERTDVERNHIETSFA